MKKYFDSAQPIVTWAIIAACIVVYILEYYAPSGISRVVQNQALSAYALAHGQYQTLIVSMFMHGSLLHITCNMVSLYYLGTAMEELLGHVKFTVVYFLAGIAGGLVFTWLSPTGSCVGASGAIFGLFGAYGIMLIIEAISPRVLYRPTFSSVLSFLGFLALNIVLSFSPGIAWQAHIGGCLCGILLGLAFYLPMRHEMLPQTPSAPEDEKPPLP